MTKSKGNPFLIGIGLAAALAVAGPAWADVNFAGKKVQIVVPVKEGGGLDRYARLLQPFFQKYLPGNPTVLVFNKPGGGTVKGTNWFERNAKPDGLTVLGATTSVHTTYVFGGKKVKFKELGWRSVIVSPLGTVFYARTETGVKGKDPVADVKALRAGNWITSGKTPNSAELRMFLALDMLGIKNVKPVFGVSTGKRRKAVIRGEMQLSIDSAGAFMKKTMPYVKKGVVVPWMTLGFAKPDGTIVRDPLFPDLPSFPEVFKAVNGKAPSGTDWAMLRHLFNMGVMASKGIMLPNGTPDDIRSAWITAAKKALKDPELLKLAKQEMGAYPQSFGDAGDAIVRNAVDVAPDAKSWMDNWIKTTLKKKQ